jgi:Protein of unknown function (DUF3618)
MEENRGSAGPTAEDRSAGDLVKDLSEQVSRLARQQLGETVEALAAKTDVRARMRAKAGEVSAHIRDKAARLEESVRSADAPKASRVKDEAFAVVGSVKQAVQESAQRAVSRGAGAAKKRCAPLATAAAAAVLLLLLASWLAMRRRRRQ